METTTAVRAAWQACRAQQRCSRGVVGVTGADIVRISRALAVEPWRFTQTAPAAVADPAGIVLDKGRRRVTLTLANAAQGCVFLLRTAGGASCCGLGALAPTSCRVFPADPTSVGPMSVDPTSASPESSADPEGSASPEGSDPQRSVGPESGAPVAGHPSGCRCAERTGSHQHDLRGWVDDQAHWHETVLRWNRQFADVSAAATGIEDFQRYLLEAQAAREAGVRWPEEVAA
jgi:hypothetical protein